MNQHYVVKLVWLVATVSIWSGATASSLASIVNLTTAGSRGTIGGATFQQMNQHPTGTGVIDPFLRIKHNTTEAAYNTSGNLPSSFDQLGGSQYNRDLLLSSVPIVNGSYQFLLDINEMSSRANPLLSLNQLQIFQTSTPGQTAGSWNASNGRLNTVGLVGLSPVYDMNPGGGMANGVTLNYALNPGSGWGDMYLYLPTSMFNPAAGNCILFYSQFGRPGNYPSDAGFEEWAVFGRTPTPVPTPVPEPTTMIAGLLLLIPFAASILRFCRKRTA